MKHRKPAPAWHRLGLKISKKVVVGITAAATAFGGLAIASTAAQAASIATATPTPLKTPRSNRRASITDWRSK